MRLTAALLILLVGPLLVAGDTDGKALSPEQAAKKVNEKVTVEMDVQSVGKAKTGGLIFLNSLADFKDSKNFTVVLDTKAQEKLKSAKIEDPQVHFKGKRVRVTGTVTLFKERPQILVSDPGQIEIVEKK